METFDDKTITQKILCILGVIVLFGIFGIIVVLISISELHSNYQNLLHHTRLITTLRYTYASLPGGTGFLISFFILIDYFIRGEKPYQRKFLSYTLIGALILAFVFEVIGSTYFSYLLDKKGYSYCFVMSNHAIHDYVSDHKYCKSGYTLEQLEAMETHS